MKELVNTEDKLRKSQCFLSWNDLALVSDTPRSLPGILLQPSTTIRCNQRNYGISTLPYLFTDNVIFDRLNAEA